MDFYSAYAQGFARVAACTEPVAIADPASNASTILEQARACHDDSVAVAVFPELALTGYSLDDLFLQETLLRAVDVALDRIAAESTDLMPVLVVGAPLVHGTRVLNCAVVIHRGKVLGVAPKSYLPNYREFYERRWFAPGDDRELEWITVAGQDVRFGPDLIFAGRPGSMRERRWALPMGPEDLTYWPSTDRIWSVTEHPRRRWILSMDRRWFA